MIVAGILIAVNVIGAQLFSRLDLTEDKEFVISGSTKSILRRLDDVVSIKVFFSKKLPPQLTTLEQQVADLLKEYQVYSKGKCTVRFVDPGVDEETKGQARAMGIPEIQMQVVEKDQLQLANVFMGIGIQFGDQTQSIPVVQDLTTLEYDITSAIVKLTRKEEPAIGFLTGQGERTLEKDYEAVQKSLETQYSVRSVDLSQGRVPVPDDIKTLIVPGSKNVPDRVEYQLDQYIMRGGKVIFLLDSITMNEQMGLQAYPSRSGLEDLLGHYGVAVQSSLALDVPPRNGVATFSQGWMAYSVQYPYWPKVTPQLSGFSRANPIVASLESLTLPWAAPIDLKLPREPEPDEKKSPAEVPVTFDAQPGLKATVLARTTDHAWTQAGRYDLNPQSVVARPAQAAGQMLPLAVLASGTFRSFYAGKAVPAVAGDSTASPVGETPIAESPETQILVIGNSQFCSNQFLRLFPENALFIENAIDYLATGNELIAIRSRGATDRPVKPLSEGAKAAIKWFNTLGIPALVVAFGLARRAARKNFRDREAAAYQGGSRS